MTARRARIPPRRRFFLGCEGESEQSYGALLQIIADESLQLRVHLDLQLLGGGDPLAIVEAAVEKARERAQKRGRFVRRAVLLDSDRHGHAPERDNRLLHWLRHMACCSFGSVPLTKRCYYAIYLSAKL